MASSMIGHPNGAQAVLTIDGRCSVYAWIAPIEQRRLRIGSHLGTIVEVLAILSRGKRSARNGL